MAWATRTLLLDDGREVVVECNDTQCYERRGMGWQDCPGIVGDYGCAYRLRTGASSTRPAACRRAEARQKAKVALDKSGGAGVE